MAKLLYSDNLEQLWCSNLRMMSYPLFMILVDMIKGEITPDPMAFREDVVTAEKKVAMTLYYLKDQGSYRMTANTFGIAKSTLSKILRQVIKAIIDILEPTLCFPRLKKIF